MTPHPDTPTARAIPIGVFLGAFFLLAMGTWARPLFDADEGRYASVALNMSTSGDWVVPHLNEMPFMDKPPLVYWVQAVWYSAFGPSEFGARLPTLLAGALVALLLFLFARDWIKDRSVRWIVAGAWVTSCAAMIGSRVGPQMDMPLCACICGALYAAWCGLKRPSRRAAIGLGVAVGCGLLVKGPLVVAVPVLVALGWRIAGVETRRLCRVGLSPWSWGTALAIAAPWYVLVERAQPGWIEHFILYEHFGRFRMGDHRSFHPFWFYVPIALAYMAPWTPFAWGGARGFPALFSASPWWRRTWRSALPGTVSIGGTGPIGATASPVRLGDLAFVWFAAAFVLYSLATRKLINYLLPAAPPLFLLIGPRLARGLRTAPMRVVMLPLWIAAAMGLAAVLIHGGWLQPLRSGVLPSEVEQPRAAALVPWLAAAAGILALASVRVLRIETLRSRALVLFLGVALAWWSADFGLARVGGLGSSQELAAALRAAKRPGDALVSLKRYPQGLQFYGGPNVWIAGGTPDAWWQREIVNPYAARVFAERPAPGPKAEGRGSLLTTEGFEALWQGRRRVVLICRWREVELLGAHVLAGPFAGAGRTDLYLATNLR